jgi:hypothetical protein
MTTMSPGETTMRLGEIHGHQGGDVRRRVAVAGGEKHVLHPLVRVGRSGIQGCWLSRANTLSAPAQCAQDLRRGVIGWQTHECQMVRARR